MTGVAKVLSTTVSVPRRPGRREQAGKVENLEGRVRRRLQVEEVAAPGHGRLDGVVVGCVDQLDIDTDTWQVTREEQAGTAVGVLDGHHSPARLEQSVQRGRDRGHAGRGGRGGRAALELAQLLLEHGDRRICVPAVYVAMRSTGRHVVPLVEVLIAEPDAVHHGNLGRSVEEVAILAAPHRPRVESVEIVVHGPTIRCKSRWVFPSLCWCSSFRATADPLRPRSARELAAHPNVQQAYELASGFDRAVVTCG